MREPQKGEVNGKPPIRESLVIGGGLAGAIVGVRLAVAGRDVLLIEKERGAHHKVCGEFLSPEATAYLRQAGVDPLRLGATTVSKLRVSSKARVVETELPFSALSVSRNVLDAYLLKRAADAGCEVRVGVSVESLLREDDGWTARLSDGSVQRARAIFLATGKHDLRGWSRPPGRQGDLVGFKLHWRLGPDQTRALRGFMDLFLFDGGYGGLALVENDTANLCLVVRRTRLRSLGGWNELLTGLRENNALIAERLEGAASVWERPLAISSIPYGYLAESEDGPWRIGDQAAVIPSFTGDGMAIALHSGALAADMYLAGKSINVYHRLLRNQLARSMRVATLLSRAMVSPTGRELAPLVIPFLPQPIGWIAKATRIPHKALRREFAPCQDSS